MTDGGTENDWHGEWLNPPPEWHVDATGTLCATTNDRTDFWQSTYYGFRRDDGHALLQRALGNFTATLTFSGGYDALYDQAGLMLRAGPEAWIKFGIEQTDGMAHLSVVVTRDGMSDWSAQPFVLNGPVTMRATRLSDAILLQWSPDGGVTWLMVRLAPAPFGNSERGADDRPALLAGPYLCSPERSGFKACFHAFPVTAPQVQKLHE